MILFSAQAAVSTASLQASRASMCAENIMANMLMMFIADFPVSQVFF